MNVNATFQDIDTARKKRIDFLTKEISALLHKANSYSDEKVNSFIQNLKMLCADSETIGILRVVKERGIEEL